MRPSSTPATIVEKLSSLSTRSEACRATSVPPRPIAMPMLARRSAGASLTPSPVTATKCPLACAADTSASFCSGVARANTRACPITARSCSGVASASCAPCTTSDSSLAMPSSRAIASAVRGWSPVTMTTRIPASAQRLTASAAPSRSGSTRPTSPRNSRLGGLRRRRAGVRRSLARRRWRARVPACRTGPSIRRSRVRPVAARRRAGTSRARAPGRP